MKNFKVVISKSIDPFFNIKTDEYMLKLAGNGIIPPTVRFYKNSKSVIIGRFQCPEMEIDEKFCKRNGIPVIRRISGGGTVFHDQGNLNIAIYLPEKFMPAQYVSESMKVFSQCIANTLSILGFPAEIDKHNSVLISGRKVSGSAGAKKFGGFLFHATLLLNADRETMKKALHPKIAAKTKKRCVLSNRYKTINLYEIKFVPEEKILATTIEQIKVAINTS